MAFMAVACVILLFFAALGASWFWRDPTPGRVWYGNSAFAWGIWCLSVYITWPTIKALL